ncbi:SDR family oxidoreductase [Flammeovirga kamogawensis]|uniref:SDR family oxidoreductase n=1 Tax=Flammeovirga kamogawensis TaxID=373891 RepID=A0ABX8GRB1_9BACT|nr:SDR family oxidoreductase [Flammeovirga kamogawensis]MBB6462109.1 short-subunit dehydrogenase [Flammeovirga kamogawensis]QWG05843.1 SDR family oxidoreductase [Flammeovirga kamogawensis]TRX67668.1 SDR family oxidoreductase [Flammeovirga kamogawensis]
MAKKQTIFITGASSGIGKSIAAAAVKKGYNVIGTSRNPDSTKDKLEGVKYVALDVSSSESIDACWNEIKDTPIDVLINNAGQSQIGPVEETSMEKFRFLFEVNFFGVLNLTKKVLPQMRERRGGTIINVGSLNGRFAAPYYSSYCATKFAMSGWTQSLRSEMKEFGVTVALVEPNHIASNIVPDFNCSEDSEYFPYADNIRQSVKGSMSEAEASSVISDTVMEVIETKAPSPIYVSGGNASMLAFAKRFLPDAFAEKLIRKTYGLKD